MSYPTLSVVIPARDEVASVGYVVEGVRECVRQLALSAKRDVTVEVIVVDDHSTDGTDVVARSAGADLVVVNLAPPGYGNAVRTGLFQTSGEWVSVMTADGSDDPADLTRMLRYAIEHDEACFGDRWCAGGHALDYDPVKRVLNRAGNHAARLLLGARSVDLTNPFKVYKSALLRDSIRRSVATGLAAGFELACHYALRHPFGVVPVCWRDRYAGRSKSSPPQLAEYAAVLLSALHTRLRGTRRVRPHGGNSIVDMVIAYADMRSLSDYTIGDESVLRAKIVYHLATFGLGSFRVQDVVVTRVGSHGLALTIGRRQYGVATTYSSLSAVYESRWA